MSKVKVLIEVATKSVPDGFERFAAATESAAAAQRAAVPALDQVAGLGVELDLPLAPVPMFGQPPESSSSAPSPQGMAGHQTMPVAPWVLGSSSIPNSQLSGFGREEPNPDVQPTSVVLPAEVESHVLDAMSEREGVVVWPNSPVALYPDDDVIDLARSRPGLDCRPFRDGVAIEVVRTMLGVRTAWGDGFRGQNIAVAIIDEGVNGVEYPVVDGFARPDAQQPGAAAITSHGSMCAADVLVAAPAARLYDYPFLGIANSGGLLTMFQAVLDHRRLDGTPHLTTNSYGYTGVPPVADYPRHEVHDPNHPVHRKVREVVASGAACFFAAGNCGADCPSGACHPSGIGPGKSIHASNSLAEVITVAAVNTRHERIGYSSQGPGMFAPEKPDLASYSHFFGNFGPDRPGGTSTPFDSGTSAATPVAAGVGALLMSAFPGISPEELRTALLAGLTTVSAEPWDPGYGRGIVNAGASYSWLRFA
ncbi:MAG: S8 family peptidase [Actinomycetales bacterium]